jgi:hypothetical protein
MLIVLTRQVTHNAARGRRIRCSSLQAEPPQHVVKVVKGSQLQGELLRARAPVT